MIVMSRLATWAAFISLLYLVGSWVWAVWRDE